MAEFALTESMTTLAAAVTASLEPTVRPGSMPVTGGPAETEPRVRTGRVSTCVTVPQGSQDTIVTRSWTGAPATPVRTGPDALRMEQASSARATVDGLAR